MNKPMYVDSLEEIVKWHWVKVHGFSADSCGQCKCTVNVIANGAGWECPNCGDYNIQPWSGHTIPHENPDFGFTRAEILQAYQDRDAGICP